MRGQRHQRICFTINKGLFFIFSSAPLCAPHQQRVRKRQDFNPKICSKPVVYQQSSGGKSRPGKAKDDEWIDKTANIWTGPAAGSAWQEQTNIYVPSTEGRLSFATLSRCIDLFASHFITATEAKQNLNLKKWSEKLQPRLIDLFLPSLWENFSDKFQVILSPKNHPWAGSFWALKQNMWK